ncbi:MAG: hypothetical protein E7085_03200 [Parabacteroides distasonis]|nr:hypothetical protein [Parabacteroides distasonis]
MKIVFFLLLLFVVNSSMNAQINRYDNPTESTYNNTYVSPDYDNIIKMGSIIKQRREKIKSLINKIRVIYESYPIYPDKIDRGWHNAYYVCEKDNMFIEIRTYVNDNNEITAIDFEGDKISNVKEKIVKGRSVKDGSIIYLIEDIWLYNKYN